MSRLPLMRAMTDSGRAQFMGDVGQKLILEPLSLFDRRDVSLHRDITDDSISGVGIEKRGDGHDGIVQAAVLAPADNLHSSWFQAVPRPAGMWPAEWNESFFAWLPVTRTLGSAASWAV